MVVGITIFKMLVICFVLSSLSEFIASLLSDAKIVFKRKVSAIVFNLILYLLSCTKCFTFWTTLIFTGDLFIAAVVSILTDIAKEVEYKIKSKIEL